MTTYKYENIMAALRQERALPNTYEPKLDCAYCASDGRCRILRYSVCSKTGNCAFYKTKAQADADAAKYPYCSISGSEPPKQQRRKKNGFVDVDGNAVREYAIAKKMTIKQLAEIAGMSYSTATSELYKGRMHKANVASMAQALGVETEALLLK